MINWKFLVIAIFSLICTSCLNVIEELSLDADGSGYYSVTFDLGGVFYDAELKEIIREMMYSQQDHGMDYLGTVDTVISFNDLPDYIRQGADRPDFWDEVMLEMRINERDKVMMAKLSFPFQHVWRN